MSTPLQSPAPGGPSPDGPQLERLPLPAESSVGTVPLEGILATPGTGGGRRRAGLRVVAAQLAGAGSTAVGLLVEGRVAAGENGVAVRSLPELGASLEWVGDALHGPALVQVARDFVAAAPEPGEGPGVYALAGAIVVDFSIAGRRPAVGVVLGADRSVALPPRGVLTVVAGMLRADAWRRQVEGLVGILAEAAPAPQGPVTSPQEAAAWAAEEAATVLDGICAATGHAQGSVHLPDPDDGLVWELAVRGGARRARHGGVTGEPLEDDVLDGIAAEAMAPLAGGAAVRRLCTAAERAALQAARGLPPEMAGEGPLLIGRRPLAPSWSPSRRNLVLVLPGEPAAAWARPAQPGPLNADEQLRLAAVLERLHDRVLGALERGLARWRDTLRAAVLGEQERRTGAAGLARTLAAGLGAAAVSVWEHRDGALHCAGASGALAAGLPEFSLADELLDPREHGILHQPSFRPAGAISEEGFLHWGPVADQLGRRPVNVGTVPLRREGRVWGLVRVDEVRPLFSALPTGSGAAALRRWLPERVPAHARELLEELARWLALGTAGGSPAAEAWDWSPAAWRRFVAEASAGGLPAAEVDRRLAALDRLGPTRGAVAARLGVHRNTLRRQLQAVRAGRGTGPGQDDPPGPEPAQP